MILFKVRNYNKLSSDLGQNNEYSTVAILEYQLSNTIILPHKNANMYALGQILMKKKCILSVIYKSFPLSGETSYKTETELIQYLPVTRG